MQCHVWKPPSDSITLVLLNASERTIRLLEQAIQIFMYIDCRQGLFVTIDILDLGKNFKFEHRFACWCILVELHALRQQVL